jgi:hypothetical protein
MIARDVRHAFRALRRAPAFTAGVVGTFAIAIGATAAMYGLVNRLMLAPPPGVRDASSLVRVLVSYGGAGSEEMTMSTVSYPFFLEVAAETTLFSGVAAARVDNMTAGRGEDLAPVAVVQASGDWFHLLGVRAVLGRVFDAEDDVAPVGNDVVVLSHAYWVRQFAGDPAVIGRDLVVDGQRLTIIGVTQRGFRGTGLASVDVFLPLSTALRPQGTEWWSSPDMRLVSIVARLRDAVPRAIAAQRLVNILRDGGAAEMKLVATPLAPLVGATSGEQAGHCKRGDTSAFARSASPR